MLLRQVFHDIEKKIIGALRKENRLTADRLESLTGLSADQIRRGIEWLKLKGIASVTEDKKIFVSLGKNGKAAYSDGLPERQLLDMLKNPMSVQDLQKSLGAAFGPAMGIVKKNNWIADKDGTLSIISPVADIPGEDVIRQIGNSGKLPESEISNPQSLELLKKRPDFIIKEVVKSKTIQLLDESIDVESTTGAIDVEAGVPTISPARIHPLNETIEEVREVFVTLGFSEIVGSLAQPCFWNFDALFTPQDHPAREMQDTFYLDSITSRRFATANQIRSVASSHEKNWEYDWSPTEAKRTVLRTHTTPVTIQHLAKHRPNKARVFSMGRVFRNEKVSYKHLVEFNQVEGVVTGGDTTLRDLMGIQTEFYRRMGMNRVKFWPTFFPYTEPSLQSMVYNERLEKWVELFGMGIFRPEVTKPLGIDGPVLAWGGGIERIAMMRYSLDDVREFYNNNLGWLRGAVKCR